MSIISNIFNNLKKANKKAFIPFITAGDGGMDNTEAAMFALANNGADIIELGMPFSDPMADGEVISKSHERAVADGVNLHDVFALVERFREHNNKTAIILMGYTNPIESFGYEAFIERAKEVEIDGVLIVDMPPEESLEFKKSLAEAGIDLIFLVSPTTATHRLEKIAKLASGFIYFISLKGVTGASNIDVNSVEKDINKIKKFIKMPIGVGFGIKDVKTAKELSKISDAVVIGSSIVSMINDLKHNKDAMITKISNFAKEISQAINK